MGKIVEKSDFVKSKTVFLTTVFPGVINFLDDFFTSLLKQTTKDFDVLVINDELKDFEYYIAKYSNLNIIEVKCSLSPAKNRETGIKRALELGYKYIVFGDSDDYFDINRINVCIDKLKMFDIVLNDLTLFNTEGVIEEHYISNRIENNSEIGLSYIFDKNVFGLSNTAIRASIIDRIEINDNIQAVDWFIFSKLLLNNRSVIFTNETKTYYRQYSSNMATLGNISLESIKITLLVKKAHYKALRKYHNQYEILFAETRQLEKAINDNKTELSQDGLKNLLWWESTKLLSIREQ